MHYRMRFFIWLILVICLMGVWLFVWKTKTEPQVENTAFSVAKTQILNNANTYRQLWMLNKQPQQMFINGLIVSFSKNGWPFVIKENKQIDCDKWLQLLWPDIKVYGRAHKSRVIFSLLQNAECEYQFSNKQIIDFKMNETGFSISANILNN
ncbi:MAG: hypothetical protein ACK5NC_12760 [Vibrio sp.]